MVKDLIKGTGPAATASSTVNVQYVGELYKGGKQFDASWNDGRGQPVSLPLTGVIKGWQQGIPGMKVGGRRELIIPPSLGYGVDRPVQDPRELDARLRHRPARRLVAGPERLLGTRASPAGSERQPSCAPLWRAR